MSYEATPALRPDLFAQLAATDPFQSRARRLFERGRVLAVNGNQADLCVGYDAHSNPLELKEVPIISGYLPRVGDWVAIQYEAGHSGAPWVTGPSMAEDDSQDSPGIGVFSVSSDEPLDPQKSTVYFDEAHSTWRGWDGSDWVDLPSRLHNALTDLQGGAAEEYYHFSAAEHGALQDLHDGDGMASAWIKRLNFSAIDQSATQRTRLFEKDGDFFWAINATYDEQADQWNRIDATKHAYLIALHSKNDIPTEPIGGIAWWRAAPGVNPIGDWAAVGGWELGFMMTEHRNYVMGGINLEIDGSGSPPYGRLTHLAGNDPAGDHTLIQHNSWYEGSDCWGRDNVDDSFAYGVDGSGDWFWWHYPSSGSSPWNTADWEEYARMHISASLMARLDVFRRTGETASGQSSFLAKHITSGDMADGFGAGYGFAIEDNAAVENIIAAIYAVRDGADNTGRLEICLASAGSLGNAATLNANGLLSLADINLSSPSSIYDLNHDSFSGYDPNEHMDATAWAANLVPDNDSARALGSSTKYWAQAYMDSLYLKSNVYFSLAGSALILHGAAVTTFSVDRDGADVAIRVHEDAGTHDCYMHFRRGTRDWKVGWIGGVALAFDYEGGVKATLSTAGTLDLIGHLEIDGDRVVTNRQSAIADASEDGAAADGICRAKVNEILAALRTHGLIAS